MEIKVAKGLPPPPDLFLHNLQKCFGNKLKVTIQKNRANLLHIRRFFNRYQLSMHYLFYEMEEHLFPMLLQFAKKGRAAKQASSVINAYIESKSYLISRQNKQGVVKGKVYDLRPIFSKVNNIYFQGKLDLFLTWVPARKSRGSMTLGSYEKGNPKGLIKVNRILDSHEVPEYFVEFVVYHEALHDLFPVQMNGNRRVIHSREFRQREKLFEHYQLARKWEKEIFSKATLR